MELEVKLNVIVDDQDIDDIMVGALEGGINYWCRKAEVVEDKYLGEYASEQISRGGSLRLYDMENDDFTYVLDKEKLLAGIQKWLFDAVVNTSTGSIFETREDGIHLDCCNIDGSDCDSIVQYAVMGDLVFG